MKNVRHGFAIFFAVVTMTALIAGAAPPAAAEVSAQQGLVDAALVTFNNFMRAESMTWLRDHLHEARGLLIIPNLLRGGFILGGSGGRGVLLVRDAKGQWSPPAYYSLGSVNFGLLIGGEAAEVLMVIRTQAAVDKLLASSSFKLGGDLAITVGPFGGGAKTNIMADIYSFALSRGLYVGVSLEGAIVATRDEWNAAYYGGAVSPAEILILNSVSNPGAENLRQAIAQAAVVR
ncbi:MAG: lipid-binding SYLF domain-containing protein [Desulfobacterales bacterium]